jgi:hypothetical protein
MGCSSAWAFVLIITAMNIGGLACAQEITHLTNWQSHSDVFADKNALPPVTATSPIAGLGGARVSMKMTCVQASDSAGEGVSQVFAMVLGDRSLIRSHIAVDLHLVVTGAGLDVATKSQPHTATNLNGTTVTTYSQDQTIQVITKDGEKRAEQAPILAPDRHALDLRIALKDFAEGDQYLIGFSANGTELAIQLNRKHPVVIHFLQACQVAADQLKANVEKAKQDAEQAAADRKANAAKAAQDEQQESERRLAENKKKSDARSLIALASFVGLGPVPDDAIVSNGPELLVRFRTTRELHVFYDSGHHGFGGSDGFGPSEVDEDIRDRKDISSLMQPDNDKGMLLSDDPCQVFVHWSANIYRGKKYLRADCASKGSVYIPADAVMYPGQAGALSQPQRPRDEGYWIDSRTGLMWVAHDNGADIDWIHGRDYCQYLRLGGSTDWRLPTPSELQRIYDPTSSRQTTPLTQESRFKERGKLTILPVGASWKVHTAGEIKLSAPAVWSSEVIGPGKARFAKAVSFTDGIEVEPTLDLSFGMKTVCVRNP